MSPAGEGTALVAASALTLVVVIGSQGGLTLAGWAMGSLALSTAWLLAGGLTWGRQRWRWQVCCREGAGAERHGWPLPPSPGHPLTS